MHPSSACTDPGGWHTNHFKVGNVRITVLQITTVALYVLGRCAIRILTTSDTLLLEAFIERAI